MKTFFDSQLLTPQVGAQPGSSTWARLPLRRPAALPLFPFGKFSMRAALFAVVCMPLGVRLFISLNSIAGLHSRLFLIALASLFVRL